MDVSKGIGHRLFGLNYMLKVNMMGPDLVKELEDILTEEIKREQSTLLQIRLQQAQGWTLVVVDANVDFTVIGTWIGENIKHEWRAYDNRWLFENSNDATLFKMTWM